MIIGVDPGYTHSAWCELSNGIPGRSSKESNEAMITRLRDGEWPPDSLLVIEGIASYGMPVGKEVFETCVWIGRFAEAWGGAAYFVYRRDVKMHLCGTARAKDGNIRAALLDKFGGAKACGTKKSPGPLYGVSGDRWSALAVAITWAETQPSSPTHEPS